MGLKLMRAVGLVLVMLPLIFLILWNIVNYLPTGDYPYTVLEQWLMGVLEVVVIGGIALAFAMDGRVRVLGVLMAGVPVVVAGVLFVVTGILPGWADVPILYKGALFAGVGFEALGFYLQLTPKLGAPFRKNVHRAPRARSVKTHV
ncbi:MAG: hypothetical protein KGI26_06035 [Thaumarchaeota archaeon]|nr:hypothetical protein [Nitrososphaerota archaeon]